MATRGVPLRQAFIMASALGVGSAAGSAAQAAAVHLGYTGPELGRIATAVVSLWIFDRLNQLIEKDH